MTKGKANQSISDVLRAAIHEATAEGITLYQIAKGCDLDWRIVNGFANGQNPNIRIGSADALAEYFGFVLTQNKRQPKKAPTTRKQTASKPQKKAAKKR